MSNYDKELFHYGIKGQKWGIRRFQNPDGTLTAEGRKRAKQEYKADNKEAYEKGRLATIADRAAVVGINAVAKVEDKLNKAYAKDPQGLKRRTQRLRDEWNDRATASMRLAEAATQYRKEAEDHCKTLIDKYGKEAVKDIKYKEQKFSKSASSKLGGIQSKNVMNENVNRFSDWALAGAATLGSFGLSYAAGFPIALLVTPTGKADKAISIANEEYMRARAQRTGNQRGWNI